jgi:hypothetical protein
MSEKEEELLNKVIQLIETVPKRKIDFEVFYSIKAELIELKSDLRSLINTLNKHEKILEGDDSRGGLIKDVNDLKNSKNSDRNALSKLQAFINGILIGFITLTISFVYSLLHKSIGK